MVLTNKIEGVKFTVSWLSSSIWDDFRKICKPNLEVKISNSRKVFYFLFSVKVSPRQWPTPMQNHGAITTYTILKPIWYRLKLIFDKNEARRVVNTLFGLPWIRPNNRDPHSALWKERRGARVRSRTSYRCAIGIMIHKRTDFVS